MQTYRCPMCFMKDVDVTFLVYDLASGSHHCKQCTYAGTTDEVEQLLTQYCQSRYKGVRPHPFAERVRQAGS